MRSWRSSTLSAVAHSVTCFGEVPIGKAVQSYFIGQNNDGPPNLELPLEKNEERYALVLLGVF